MSINQTTQWINLKLRQLHEPVNIGAFLGGIGAIFVALGQSTPANMIWTISNMILVYHNQKIGQHAQARMFALFAILALGGTCRAYLGIKII
jgi:hypothetical protein